MEADTGIVAFELDIVFNALNAFQLLIREQDSDTSSFTSVVFTQSGQISISDKMAMPVLSAPIRTISYIELE